jgi:hypothetical protein
MRMYTENISTCSRDALWGLIKTYYDKYIFGKIEDAQPWSLECISEHFSEHTRFPTDLILNQISVQLGIQKHIEDALVAKGENGKVFVDRENTKLLISINKEIRELLAKKKEISTMIGYSEILDY